MIGQVLDLFKKEDDNDPNKNSRDDVNFGKKKFVKMPNATLGALAGLAYNPVSMLVKNIGNPEAYPYKILPIKYFEYTEGLDLLDNLFGS